MGGEKTADGRCPTCGEAIAHIFLSAGEYTYKPCGCPVPEDSEEE
jgi:hypothetical protein